MRKILASVAVIGLTALSSWGQRSLKEITQLLKDTKTERVLVVAHRGDWRNAPENSLEALKRAIDIGADIIEIDIQKSKDGVLVLMHDKTLNRTTSGKGKVSDFTLEELKALTLRTGSGSSTRQRIPTLEEAMNLVKGKVYVNLDKGYHHLPEIEAVLKKTGTMDQVIMKATQSYDEVTRDFGEVLHQMYFMPMTDVHNKQALEEAREYQQKLNIYSVEAMFKDTASMASGIQYLKDIPLKIWFNSLWGGIDDELAVIEGKPDASWGWLIKKGATIIQTDRPKELIAYLKQINKY